MNLLSKYVNRVEFDTYEDFKRDFRINVPENFNFGYDIVDAYASAEPDKLALVWCDDHGGEKTLTFGELSGLSNQCAHAFRARGIDKGDAVLVILRRRWEYWVAATALHKLGATIIPAVCQLTEKDIAYRMKAAGCKMLLDLDGLDEFRESWKNYPLSLDRVATLSSDIMLEYFTSGTTGMPKIVRHTFAHPLGHIVTAKYWQQVREDCLHMSVSDSGWAKFGWGKIYGQWIAGAVIFAYDFDKYIPKLLLEKLEKYKVTTFCAPPTMFRFMLQEDVSQYDLSSLKNCGNAGEPLSPEVFREFERATGLQLREGFGQSETTVLVANFEWFEPRPGSMGKPSPLYDIELLDDDGNPCAEGVEGELVIRNHSENVPGLFLDYTADPEKNASIVNGEYHTGDIAWRDGDGYYWFVGRNDDVIKCSGYRIGPFEVESSLLEHPAVLECAVTAAPDELRGQVVKATVVLKQGFSGSPELVKELQNHVKNLTAPYKYPRIVEFVPELPKTVSGKIKRAEIRNS